MLKGAANLKKSNVVRASIVRNSRAIHTTSKHLSQQYDQTSSSPKAQLIESTPESWKKIAQKELGQDPLEKLYKTTPEVWWCYVFWILLCFLAFSTV